MNTEKITLPGFLIADLYKDSLVDLDTLSFNQTAIAGKKLRAEAEDSVSAPDKIIFLGENLRKVIFVVNEPGEAYLNKEDLTFLTNILKACQLTLADIAIVNTAKQQVTYTAIKEQLFAMQIVLFDVEPSFIKLPFIIPPFQVQTFADTTIMLAPALSALNRPDGEGKLLKTKLWNSLKQVFGIQ